MVKNFLLLLLLAVFGCASWSWSQSRLLSFSPGAASLGYGRTGVVEIYDPSALYWNPAILGALRSNQSIVAIHQPFLLNYAGYSHFFPLYGSFAVNIGKTDGSEDAIEFGGFGWGFQLSRHFYAGFAFNAFQIGHEGWTTGGVGFLFKPMSPSPAEQNFTGNGFLASPYIADRLTIGFAVQNIPLVVSDYDHQIRLGLSYAITEYGPKIVYAYHFQRGLDTGHFGLVSTPMKNLQIFAGMQDFNPEQFAFAVNLALDNFKLGLAYSLKDEKVAFTASFRIGPAATTLAAQASQKASLLLAEGKRRQALREGKKALAYDPKQAEASKIVAELEPVIKAENKHIDSLFLMARGFEKKGWYIKAATTYLKILRLDPQNSEAETAIQLIRPKVNIYTEKLYQLGVRYFNRGDYKKAKGIFESILLVRHDHRSSREYLNKIEEIYRKQAEEHYYTGLGFYSQRNLDRAEEEFKAALELEPNYKDALDYLERIKKDRQQNVQRIKTLTAQAQAAEKKGYWVRALNTYRQILQIDPANKEARQKSTLLQRKINSFAAQQYVRGQNAYKKGDLQAAQKAFRAVLSVQPGHNGARHYLNLINESTNNRAEKYMRLANDYYQNENWEAAISILDSVLSISPNSASARQLRDKALSKLGTEKILEHAKSQYLSGQYLQALEKFNEVLERDPQNPDALELREQCQARLNDLVDEYFNRGIQLYTEEKYRSAIAEWEKALKINPYHKGSLEYKKKAEERLEALHRLP